MPRKYRPPAARRRKNRTTNIPYDTGVAEENNTWATPEPVAESPEVEVTVEEAVSEASATRGEGSVSLPKERHVSRDYSYVRGEIARILVIASLLFVGLIVVAILRN